MERKEFLDRMQRAIVSAAQNAAVAPEDTVQYEGHAYYPYAYTLTCDAQGQWLHQACIHSLKANSVMKVSLDKVNGEPLIGEPTPVLYIPTLEDTIAHYKALLKAAVEDLKQGTFRECRYCVHNAHGPMKEICQECSEGSNWEWRGGVG